MELELIVKVKAYGIETTFPFTADKDDFRTFIEFKFIADQKALVAFMCGLQALNS